MVWEQVSAQLRYDTENKVDVYPCFANGEQFTMLIDDLADAVSDISFDVIAGMEATGFVLGSALATRLHRGFVAIRRAGKLPYKQRDLRSLSCIDYSNNEKTFEIKKDQFRDGERVLIVDDWVETGSQLNTAMKLIEDSNATVAGGAFIAIEQNHTTDALQDAYDLRCLKVL